MTYHTVHTVINLPFNLEALQMQISHILQKYFLLLNNTSLIRKEQFDSAI